MENQSKNIQQKQIRIKGMHCQSCADKIENSLRDLVGVEEVKVSFAQEQVFVRFDREQINLDTINGRIGEIGYEASIEDNLNFPKEKIIKIRLGKPSVLTVLVSITLLLTFINLFYTTNLQNKIASVAAGVIVESESQPTGTLKEVLPSQPSQGQQPSRIEVNADGNPVKGSKGAPVTIIEFSEFECPFCERFYRQTFPLIEENYIETGEVRYVFRDFPLSFHQNAQKAAEAAECADEQGKFWEYHDKLFGNQRALDINSLKQYAKDLGLNTAKFNDCLGSGKMVSEVQKDFTDGSKYGVSGTPTFFINGIKLVGAQSYSAFEQIIEQELNKDEK